MWTAPKSSAKYLLEDGKQEEEEDEEESRIHWRYAELRSRISERKKYKSSDALLEAGKERILTLKRERQREAWVRQKEVEYDGRTKLALVQQDHAQALILRRSEQMWDTQKQLRVAKRTIRTTTYDQKGSIDKLDKLHQVILNLQELTSINKYDRDGNDLTDTGQKSAPKVLSKLLRGHGRKGVTADHQVDQELTVCEDSDKTTRECPICFKKILVSYMTEHVKNCRKTSSVDDGMLLVQQGLAVPGRTKRDILRDEKIFKKSTRSTFIKALKEGSNVATDQICIHCGKVFLSSRIHEHMSICKNVQEKKMSQERKAVLDEIKVQLGRDNTISKAEIMGQMAPQPPQGLKVIRTTSSSIELEWEPPIFTGGYQVTITDYIIEYDLCKKRREGRKIIREAIPQSQIRTSHWCLQEPVANGGYIISDLIEKTEYINIRVRAVNNIGCSDPSNPIESAETKKAVKPSPPLHLAVVKVSSSTIKLRWKKPHSDGGAHKGISMYAVFYSRIYESDEPKSNGKSVYKKEKKKTSNCEIELTGLACKSFILEVFVKAITTIKVAGAYENLTSERSNILKKVQTADDDRLLMLQRELTRVETLKNPFVNSSAYTGFYQRYKRETLIENLKRDLGTEIRKTIKLQGPGSISKLNEFKLGIGGIEEGEEEDDFIEEASRLGIMERQQRATARTTMFEAKAALNLHSSSTRRSQFQYRIARIEEEIAKQEEIIGDGIMRRAQLTTELRLIDERMRDVRVELDRARAHSGTFMDCSVVHGRSQRFYTTALRRILQDEIETLEGDLAKSKNEIVGIHHKIKAAKIKKKEKVEMKMDREAALVSFENEQIRKEKALEMIGKWRVKHVHDIFLLWARNVKANKHNKTKLRYFMNRLYQKDTVKAWNKWKSTIRHLEEREGKCQGESTGIGSFKLSQVREERFDLLSEATEEIHKIRGCTKEVEEFTHSHAQKEEIKKSPFYDEELEEKRNKREASLEAAPEFLYRHHAEIYFKAEMYEISLELFQKHGENRQAAGDTEEQCRAYQGIAKCYEATGKLDKAILYFDRSRSLALEAQFDKMEGQAFLGMARSFLGMAAYKPALEYADRALVKFEDLQDGQGQGQALRLLQNTYKGLRDEEKVKKFSEMAIKLEKDLDFKFETAYEVINKAQKKLVNITADKTICTRLEVVAAKVPHLRVEIETMRLESEKLAKEEKKWNSLTSKLENRLKTLTEQLEKVNACAVEELDSDLVHGIPQRFKVQELKSNLKGQLEETKEKLTEISKTLKVIKIQLSNVRDDLSEREKELAVEIGPLMQRIMNRKTLRCGAMNRVNLNANDVTGRGIGGVERLVCAVRDSIYVFDVRDGALLRIIFGDVPGPLYDPNSKKCPPLKGHHGAITALYYHEHTIYSGGVDKDVRAWEDEGEFKCKMIFRGHQQSVWSIFADSDFVISGSADKTIRIWDEKSGKCLKAIKLAHNKTIRCMDYSHSYNILATGGTDCEVHVWNMDLVLPGRIKSEPKIHRAWQEKVNKKKSTVALNKDVAITSLRDRQRQRFLGHQHTVTCIFIQGCEIVSGDESGKCIYWDMAQGLPLVTFKPTTQNLDALKSEGTAVSAIQFDSTKLVCGSVDQTITIYDLATGASFLTLRSHVGPILALQFDISRILSLSADGTIRQWNLSGNKDEVIPVGDKLHVLSEGETLNIIEERYGCDSKQLLKWNNMVGAESLYVGMRLIVSKGSIIS